MGRPKRAAAMKAEEPKQEETKKVKGGLAVGDQLPAFELETDEETTLSSADMVKDNGIILFAYPKANTKGCTSQAVGLSEKASELAEAGYKVYGISADKPKSQASWRNKESLEFNLLCDPSHEVLGKLGFMKGSKINRSHLIVEKGGKVVDVQYGITPKVSVKEAIEFCLAHKGEPLAADKAEEAAEAGEAAEAAEEAQEGEKEEAEGAGEDKAGEAAEEEGDKKEEEQPAEEKQEEKEETAEADEAAAMDVDAAAAEAPAAAAAEEKKEEEAAQEGDVQQQDQDQEKAAEEPAAAAAEASAEVEQEGAKAEEAPKEEEAAEEAAPEEPSKAADAAADASKEPAAAEEAAAAPAAEAAA